MRESLANSSGPRPILVLAALELELTPLRRRLRAHRARHEWRGTTRAGPVALRVTGPGSEAAAAGVTLGAQELSPRHILWVGCAGGLEPDLRPGALLLASELLRRGGQSRRPELPPASAEAAAGAPRTRVLWSKAPLRTPHEKQRAREETGAEAVDMESIPALEAARRAGVPLSILRAVADPRETTVPEGMEQLVTAEGRSRSVETLRWLLRNPGQLSATRALTRRTRAATRALAWATTRMLATWR